MKEENDIGHLRKSYEKGALGDDKKTMHPDGSASYEKAFTLTVSR